MHKMEQLQDENARCLEQELEWLASLIKIRLHSYFANETVAVFPDPEALPDYTNSTGKYADFLKENHLSIAERVALILSISTHLKPELLDLLLIKNPASDKRFSQFGGLPDTHAFIPTLETLLFILAGSDLTNRLNYYTEFETDSFLVQENILRFETTDRNESIVGKRLTIDKEYLNYFITGKQAKPEFGENFPAKLIQTRLDWEDIVLRDVTRESLQEISDWIEHGETVLNSATLGKRLKPGYKSLFYGPPGTGKTLTAALIGKTTGHEVYRIDLSMLVSKFIGETEKNLAKVFNLADSKRWILFFDEADALFGKRTEVSSSHDRFANQEVAYLLQRIEDHNGIVILASNLKENIDDAFSRRFQSVIHFMMPGPEERYQLWKQSFDEKIQPDATIDLYEIAEKHEIAGGVIMNVLRYCTLKAIKKGQTTIQKEDLERGIRRELQKQGIMFI